MHTLKFSVLNWMAWAPGVDTPEQWSAWAQGRRDIAGEARPAVEFIPALLRRRLSNLSRAALWAAHHCAAGDSSLRTVFASPHGEIERTTELLADLASASPLSPNAFSLSVHNTAAGLSSIAAGNRAAATAVAAGRDTLPAAFVEAAGALARNPAPVLLVYADMPLPSAYAPWQDDGIFPLGLGLLLGPAATSADLQLDYSPSAQTCSVNGGGLENDSERSPVGAVSPAPCLALLRLLAGSSAGAAQGERGHWRWSRG